MRRLRTLLVCSALVLSGATASAQDGADLKREGDAAFDDRRYADAIAAYDRAYERTHDPALLYNKGRAHEALGHYVQAFSDVYRFRQEAPPAVRARVPHLDALVDDLRRHVAAVTINANVAGARVVVRDVVMGETTTGPMKFQVNAGKAHVVVEKEGYFPLTLDVNLPGDSTTVVNAELHAKAVDGILRVRANVAGAAASVDGRAAGVPPLEVTLPAGEHKVSVEHEGFEPLSTTVIVDAGKSKTLDVTLAETPPITSRWWFWTSIGVLVVGGVTLAVVAGKEKDAPKGSIAPGTVSAPLVRF